MPGETTATLFDVTNPAEAPLAHDKPCSDSPLDVSPQRMTQWSLWVAVLVCFIIPLVLFLVMKNNHATPVSPPCVRLPVLKDFLAYRLVSVRARRAGGAEIDVTPTVFPYGEVGPEFDVPVADWSKVEGLLQCSCELSSHQVTAARSNCPKLVEIRLKNVDGKELLATLLHNRHWTAIFDIGPSVVQHNSKAAQGCGANNFKWVEGFDEPLLLTKWIIAYEDGLTTEEAEENSSDLQRYKDSSSAVRDRRGDVKQ